MQRFARSSIARVAGCRTLMQLSGCSPILKNNAEARGFSSPVWVEDGDEWWFKKVTSLRDGEMPTECKGPSRIELYNVDQLTGKPELPKKEVFGNHSLKTEKRYSGGFNDALEKFAALNKLDSKWWLSPAEVRKRGLRVQPGARPSVQIIERSMKMYNADQFADPAAIGMRAYSGATGRAYEDGIGSHMRGHAKANGFESVVYFTEKQLASAGMAADIGVNPLAVPLTTRGSSFKLFPVEAVDHPDEFLKKLQRFPVTEPTYVISGMPLEASLAGKAKIASVKSNYWVSENEVKARGFKIRPDAASISPESDNQMTFNAFNIEQLNEPSRAMVYRMIGRVE
jgi:hypothetical protein